jgi:hypothetical protein
MNWASRLQATPTKLSTNGKAWRVDLERYRARAGKAGGEICGWIIEAPWAHPMWHSYFLSAVHLRELPGFPPAVIHLPGATHEVMLFALNPEHTPTLDTFPKVLTPANFFGQWIAESDEAACAKLERCVDEVLAGTLSPDTDCRRMWIERFSDSNIKKEWKGVPESMVGIDKDGAVVFVGTGKTNAEIITGIAAANEPVPPKSEQH